MFKGLSMSVAVGVPVIVGTVVIASPVLKKLAEKSEAGAWLVVDRSCRDGRYRIVIGVVG